MGEMTKAARDVLAERGRQITKEGWSADHDDAHSGGEMAAAAACYAWAAQLSEWKAAFANADPSGWFSFPMLQLWPWDRQWWKPTGRRRMLVKAGALILAEIERIDRAEGRADD